MGPERGAGVSLDAILAELGQFGRYQLYNYCLILVPIVFSAVYNSQYIFAAGAVQHRCEVPACEESPPVFEAGAWGAWALGTDGGRCYQRTPLNDTCEPASFHPEEQQRCGAWLYESHDTIVATFDLACSEWRRTLVGTIHSAGLFVALPLTGTVSDMFGRKTAFVLTATLVSLVGLIRSFSTGYVMYLVLEFLDAVVGSGVYSTGFILALEMVGLKRRVIGGNIISCAFALGQVLLALVAWGVPEWRTLTRVLYVPSSVFIVYIFFIEESVRWLLSKGRKREAVRIIYKVAAINKRKLSPESMRQLSDEPAPETLPTHDKLDPGGEGGVKERSLMWEVVRSRIIMSRLLVCSFWWITVTFTYYGLSINSVTLAGNMYVNYILTSLVEIPGYALSVLTLDRFGRKRSIMTAFVICGAALIVLPFVPADVRWAITCLNLTGKLFISMAFSSIYIYTSELFPTRARHRLLATCSMVGRIGSMVAPQTPLLMTVMEALPYLIFGVMALTSAALMLLTPETLNVKLPDTVSEAEGIKPSSDQ